GDCGGEAAPQRAGTLAREKGPGRPGDLARGSPNRAEAEYEIPLPRLDNCAWRADDHGATSDLRDRRRAGRAVLVYDHRRHPAQPGRDRETRPADVVAPAALRPAPG